MAAAASSFGSHVVAALPRSLSEAASLISAGRPPTEVGTASGSAARSAAEQAASLLRSVSRQVRGPGKALAHRRAGAALIAQLRGVPGLRAHQARAATGLVLGLWEEQLDACMSAKPAAGAGSGAGGLGSESSMHAMPGRDIEDQDGGCTPGAMPAGDDASATFSMVPADAAHSVAPAASVSTGHRRPDVQASDATIIASLADSRPRVPSLPAGLATLPARIEPILVSGRPQPESRSQGAPAWGPPDESLPLAGDLQLRSKQDSDRDSDRGSVGDGDRDSDSGSDSDAAAAPPRTAQSNSDPAAMVLAALAAALRMPAASAREPSLASRAVPTESRGRPRRTAGQGWPASPSSPSSSQGSACLSSTESDDSEAWLRLGEDQFHKQRRPVPPLPLEASRPFDAFARRWPSRPPVEEGETAAESKGRRSDDAQRPLRPRQRGRRQLPLGLNAQRENARRLAQLLGSTATSAWGAVANSARSARSDPPAAVAGDTIVGWRSSADDVLGSAASIAGEPGEEDGGEVTGRQPLRLRLPVVSTRSYGASSARQARTHSQRAAGGECEGALSARALSSTCATLSHATPVASGEWAVTRVGRQDSGDGTGRHEYVAAVKSLGDTASRAVVIGLARGDVALRHHRLTPAGVHGLATAVRASTVLLALELVDCDIRDAGAVELAGALKASSSVESFALGDHPLGPQASLAVVRAAAAAPALERLLLSSAAVGDSVESASAVEGLLRRASPKLPSGPLRLASRASGVGPRVPRPALQAGGGSVSRQLRQLDLSFAQAGNAVACAIAAGMEHAPLLSRLSLAYNAIQPLGCSQLLASAARHTSLRLLDLSWNNCGELGGLEAAGTVADNCLGGGSLRSLLLAHCSIAEPAALLLADAMQFTSTLRRLALDMNPCGELAAAAVQAAAAANSKIRQCTTLDVEQTSSAAPGAGLAAQAFGSAADVPEGFGSTRHRSASTAASRAVVAVRPALLPPGHVWFAEGSASGNKSSAIGEAGSRPEPRGARSPSHAAPSRMRRFRLEEPDGEYRLELSDPTQRAVARSLLWRVRAGYGAWTRASLDSRALEASATVEGKWQVPASGSLVLSYTGRQALLDAGRADASAAGEDGSRATRRWGRVNALIAASRLLGGRDAPPVAEPRSPSPELDGSRAEGRTVGDAQLDDGLLSSLARSARLASSTPFRSPGVPDYGGASPGRFGSRGTRAGQASGRGDGKVAMGGRTGRAAATMVSTTSHFTSAGAPTQKKDISGAGGRVPDGGAPSSREATLAKAVARAEALAVSDSGTARLLLDLRLGAGRRLAALALSSGLPPPQAQREKGEAAGGDAEVPELTARGWLVRACRDTKASTASFPSQAGSLMQPHESPDGAGRPAVASSPGQQVRQCNNTRVRREHGSGTPCAAVSVVSAFLGGAPIPLGAFGGDGARVLLQRAAAVLSSAPAASRLRRQSARRMSAQLAGGPVARAGAANLGTLPRQLADAQSMPDEGAGSGARLRQPRRGQLALLLDVRVSCIPAKQAAEAWRQAQLACWHASAHWHYRGSLSAVDCAKQDGAMPESTSGSVAGPTSGGAMSTQPSVDPASGAAIVSGPTRGVAQAPSPASSGTRTALVRPLRPPPAFQLEPPSASACGPAARSSSTGKRRPRPGRGALPPPSLERELADWFRTALQGGLVPRPPPGRLGDAATPVAAAAAGLAFPGGGPPPDQLPPFVFRREVHLRLNRPGDRALAVQLLQRTIPGASPSASVASVPAQVRLGASSVPASTGEKPAGTQDGIGTPLGAAGSLPADKASPPSLAQPDAILEARLNGKVVPLSKWRRIGQQQEGPGKSAAGTDPGLGSRSVDAGSSASLESAAPEVSHGGDSVSSSARGGARWALPRSGALCLVFEARSVVAVASQQMTFETGLPGQRGLLAATVASARVNPGETIWAVSVDDVRLDWAASAAVLDPWPQLAAHAVDPALDETARRAVGGVASGLRGPPAKVGTKASKRNTPLAPRAHGVLPLLPQGCRVSLERTVVRPAFQAPNLQVTRLTLDMQRPEDVLLAQAVRARACLSAAGRLADPAHVLAAIGSTLVRLPCAEPERTREPPSLPEARPSQLASGHAGQSASLLPRHGTAAKQGQSTPDVAASRQAQVSRLQPLGSSAHGGLASNIDMFGAGRNRAATSGAGSAAALAAAVSSGAGASTDRGAGLSGGGGSDHATSQAGSARGGLAVKALPQMSAVALLPHGPTSLPRVEQSDLARGWSGTGPQFATVEGAVVTAIDALRYADRVQRQAEEAGRTTSRPISTGRRTSATSRAGRRKSMVAPTRRSSLEAKRTPAAPLGQRRRRSMATSTSGSTGKCPAASAVTPPGADPADPHLVRKPQRPRRGSDALQASRERGRSAVSLDPSVASGATPSPGVATPRALRWGGSMSSGRSNATQARPHASRESRVRDSLDTGLGWLSSTVSDPAARAAAVLCRVAEAQALQTVTVQEDWAPPAAWPWSASAMLPVSASADTPDVGQLPGRGTRQLALLAPHEAQTHSVGFPNAAERLAPAKGKAARPRPPILPMPASVTPGASATPAELLASAPEREETIMSVWLEDRPVPATALLLPTWAWPSSGRLELEVMFSADWPTLAAGAVRALSDHMTALPNDGERLSLLQATLSAICGSQGKHRMTPDSTALRDPSTQWSPGLCSPATGLSAAQALALCRVMSFPASMEAAAAMCSPFVVDAILLPRLHSLIAEAVGEQMQAEAFDLGQM